MANLECNVVKLVITTTEAFMKCLEQFHLGKQLGGRMWIIADAGDCSGKKIDAWRRYSKGANLRKST